jgi:hypothetical protein
LAARRFCNFVEKPIESSVITEPAWPLFQAWNMTAGKPSENPATSDVFQWVQRRVDCAAGPLNLA